MTAVAAAVAKMSDQDDFMCDDDEDYDLVSQCVIGEVSVFHLSSISF